MNRTYCMHLNVNHNYYCQWEYKIIKYLILYCLYSLTQTLQFRDSNYYETRDSEKHTIPTFIY